MSFVLQNVHDRWDKICDLKLIYSKAFSLWYNALQSKFNENEWINILNTDITNFNGDTNSR
jgi:hypothetical protein